MSIWLGRPARSSMANDLETGMPICRIDRRDSPSSASVLFEPSARGG